MIFSAFAEGMLTPETMIDDRDTIDFTFQVP